MSKPRYMIFAASFVLSFTSWTDEARSQQPPPKGDPIRQSAPKVSPPSTKNMSDTRTDKRFMKNLPKGFILPTTDAGKLLFREYGAVFLARNGATPPRKVIFEGEWDVLEFQSSLKRSSQTIGGYRLELQSTAMTALTDAIEEAGRVGLSITPRGSDSARRGYDQTVALWASRVNPGLAHWVGKRRMTPEEAKRIKAMATFEQVTEILRLERQGIYFAKDLSKSIIYSVAPPGGSQHLSMLALDVKEFGDLRVRTILASRGWFQTVVSDLPHFTFLGMPETELPERGLKLVISGGNRYWVPNLSEPAPGISKPE